jgi:hypothetical protein
MKLHSDTLEWRDIHDALDRAKQRGHVDRLIDFETLEEKKSRSRKNGFEIKLEWLGTKVKGDGRRWTNSGSYGANTGGSYAATRDEWGWFIAELFDKDEHAIFGHYEGMDSFNTQTRYAYEIADSLNV